MTDAEIEAILMRLAGSLAATGNLNVPVADEFFRDEATAIRQLRRERDEARAPKRAPEIGGIAKCLVCALDEPWGIFDQITGATVCVDCRNKARAPDGESAINWRAALDEHAARWASERSALRQAQVASDETLRIYKAERIHALAAAKALRAALKQALGCAKVQWDARYPDDPAGDHNEPDSLFGELESALRKTAWLDGEAGE